MSTTRTVLGPLTTTYTFPEACTNLVAAQGEGQGNAWQAQSCAVSTFSDDTYTDSQEDDAACWPTVTASTPTPPLEGWGFYSPGLVCPAGWTSACTAALSSNGQTSPVISGTSFTPQWSLTAGETAVGCCPTGYSCFGINPVHAAQTCIKRVSSTAFPRVTCTVGQFVTDETFSIPYAYSKSTVFDDNNNPESTSTLTDDFMSLYAPLIQINFKDSDRTLAASPAKTSPTTGPTQSPLPSPGGLSTGAKIAIGVVIPVVALIAAAFLLRYFYRRRQRAGRELVPVEPPTYHDRAELAETPAQYELSAADKPQELQSLGEQERLYELPDHRREQDTED